MPTTKRPVPPPSWRQRNPHLFWALVLLGVLGVLALVAVVTSDDDQEATDATLPPPVTAPDQPVADDVLAPALLPAVGALGADWIETQRDAEATEVEAGDGGDCPAGVIPEGYLVRGEQFRTAGGELVESLGVTAGVIAEGVEPISLEDPAVIDCLLEDLRGTLAEGTTAEVGAEVPVGPIDPGAQASHVRFDVTGPDGVGGTYDFVLVQRARLASLGVLLGTGVVEPTAIRTVADALDAPLQAALPALS